MTIYSYRKAPIAKKRFYFQKKLYLPKGRKILASFLSFIGISLIITVAYSLFSYKFLTIKQKQSNFVSPLVAGVSIEELTSEAETKEQGLDYDSINNWFPTAQVLPVKPSKITHYTLSIPKLRIKNAIVEIGGTKVKKSLVQYPGTALPGEFGNAVVFGHSILPIFYNPQDYKSIFSLIPTLNKGDKIYLFFDGIEYAYEVISYKEVKPDEVNVLEQRFDEQTLSLVTCVPPGTYLRRGLIKARLAKL